MRTQEFFPRAEYPDWSIQISRAPAVCKVRDFPQGKLDSEINVPFLLNKNGDLYFLLHKNIAHIILFNF